MPKKLEENHPSKRLCLWESRSAKEMAKNGQQSDTTTRRTWKRKLKTVAQVLDVLFISIWIIVFIKFILTGYLSLIGIAVVTFFIASMVASTALLLRGNKRSEKRSGQLFIGTIIMMFVAAAAVQFWPEDGDTWRPYRFEDELAVMEAKRAVPDENNAAICYKSAFAAINVKDRPSSLFRKDGHIRSEFTNYPWKGADYPEVSQWLDSHSDTIDELLLIGKMEKCRWPIQVDIYDDYTVPYASLRYCAKLLIVAGMRDLGEGRLQRALEQYFCLFIMAEHMYQQTQYLDFYCGMAYERAALQIIRYVLIRSDLSEEDMERIAIHLPTSAINWNRDISFLLEFAKFRFAHMMASVYEINEQGKVRFATSFRLLSEDKHEQQKSAKISRLWRLYWLMNMPLDPKGVWDMAEVELFKFERFLESGPMLGIYEDESSLDLLSKSLSNMARWMAQELCFDKHMYKHFKDRYAFCMTRRRGTWLVLGLRRYRDVYGKWPDRLDLISEYVPKEAFLDPTNGDKFIYIRDDDNFTLYSKGFNGVDEGGRGRYGIISTKEGDDIAIWPLTKRETKGRDND